MNPLRKSSLPAIIVSTVALACALPAQSSKGPVQSLDPPRIPLPAEDKTADSTRFSFIFYGGMRGRADGTEIAFEHLLVMQAMLDTIASRRTTPDPVRFILSNGDAVVDGRQAKQWNVSWFPVVDRLMKESGLPYYLAAGNHDVTQSFNASNYDRRVGLANYLRAVGQLIPPDGDKRRLDHYPTYAFGYGNTFVLLFDSNIPDDGKQLDWVKGQLGGLDRKRYTNVVAVAHHPAFSSGLHGYNQLERATIGVRTRWMPLFRRYHVRLFLVGHDHLYEHWVERYSDSTGRHRLDEIVSGGGGAPLYTYLGEPDASIYLGAGAEDSVRLDHVVKPGATSADNPYHFTIIHVDGDQLSLEVIGVAGGENFRPYPTPRVSLNDPEEQHDRDGSRSKRF